MLLVKDFYMSPFQNLPSIRKNSSELPNGVHHTWYSLDIFGDRTEAILFDFFGCQSPASRFALASWVGVRRKEIRSYPDRALWRWMPRELLVARRNQAQAWMKSSATAGTPAYISASLL